MLRPHPRTIKSSIMGGGTLASVGSKGPQETQCAASLRTIRSESAEEPVKHKLLGPRVSNSVDMEQSPRICISNKIPWWCWCYWSRKNTENYCPRQSRIFSPSMCLNESEEPKSSRRVNVWWGKGGPSIPEWDLGTHSRSREQNTLFPPHNFFPKANLNNEWGCTLLC